MDPVQQATALLYPAQGPRALNVKFAFAPGASLHALAQQIILCCATMHAPAFAIEDIDAETPAR